MANEFATYPAAIKPATKVVLAKVPMSGNNKDIILKDSAGAYKSWVQSKKVAEESDFSYQRQDSVIRYPGNADDIIASGANYVMWTNTNFNNKTFYAYITSVEYKNPNVSWIHIDIDAFSTFIYDTTIGYQFVERAITATDEVGDSLTSEPIGAGDYFEKEAEVKIFSNFSAILYVSGGIGGNFAFVDGIPNPNELSICSNPTSLKNKLIGLGVDPLHAPVGATAIPNDFVEGYPSGGDPVTEARAHTLSGLQLPGTLLNEERTIVGGGESYTPNNYKLFTYPYTALMITNGCDSAKMYKYEYFDGNPSFGMRCNLISPISVVAFPEYYNGGFNNLMEGITVGQMPVLPVKEANFSAAISLATSIATHGLSSTVNLSEADRAASQFASDFLLNTSSEGMSPEDYLTSYNTAKDVFKSSSEYSALLPTKKQQVKGKIAERIGTAQRVLDLGNAIKGSSLSNGSGMNANGISTMIAAGEFGLWAKKLQVRPWVAKLVDDFFSMYGYNVSSMMSVDIFSNKRPVFNYYKTVECNIPTSCPTEYRLKIQSIFDAGVRLWHDESKFCDYSEATLKANSLH